MKTNLKYLLVSCALLILSGCGRSSNEAAVMIVYHDGNEYNIIEKVDTYDDGLPAHRIRYYSKDPGNEAVLQAERADLYAIIAKHINTNEHQRVVLIAVEEQGRIFGLMKPQEVSQSLSAEEVLAYKPKDATKASAEK